MYSSGVIDAILATNSSPEDILKLTTSPALILLFSTNIMFLTVFLDYRFLLVTCLFLQQVP